MFKNLYSRLNNKKGDQALVSQKIIDVFVDYVTQKNNIEDNHSPVYYYSKTTFDSELEKELHNDVFSKLNPDCYVVIRNEGKLKLFSPNTTNPGDGFEPDFIVLNVTNSLKNYYHLHYLEVKGEHLIEHDSWKETLLIELINGKEETIDNESYKLHGYKFFTGRNKNSWIVDNINNFK